MDYIEVTVASADDLRAAAASRLKLLYEPVFDADAAGWRLKVRFQKGSQWHVYLGRLFRAPDESTASLRVEHQLKRLLGFPSRIAEKFSEQYQNARRSLEERIQRVWDESQSDKTDLLYPGPIKVDWNRREPMLKVSRPSSRDGVMERLKRRYDPELTAFIAISKAEIDGLQRPDRGKSRS